MVRQRKNRSKTDKKDENEKRNEKAKVDKEVKVSNAFGWDALEHAKFKLQVKYFAAFKIVIYA